MTATPRIFKRKKINNIEDEYYDMTSTRNLWERILSDEL